MRKKNQKGFIKMTLIIVGALVILKYAYSIDVVEFLTTGNFKIWLDTLYKWSAEGWEKYSHILARIWDYSVNLFKSVIAKI